MATAPAPLSSSYFQIAPQVHAITHQSDGGYHWTLVPMMNN